MRNSAPQSAEVISMEEIHDALRTMGRYEEEELTALKEEVSNLENRSLLAEQIADHILETRGEDGADRQEVVTAVMEQLDPLQEHLDLRLEEARRKSELFEQIDNDPEKRTILQKALDAVKDGFKFVWKHKWKILAILAIIALGWAVWYHWNKLAGLLGLGAGAGVGEGAGASGELAFGGAEAIAGTEAIAGGSFVGGNFEPITVLISEDGYKLLTESGSYVDTTLDKIVLLAKDLNSEWRAGVNVADYLEIGSGEAVPDRLIHIAHDWSGESGALSDLNSALSGEAGLNHFQFVHFTDVVEWAGQPKP